MSDPGLAEISPDAKIDFLHQFHIGENKRKEKQDIYI